MSLDLALDVAASDVLHIPCLQFTALSPELSESREQNSTTVEESVAQI